MEKINLFKGQYFFLSNFYPSFVTYNGLDYLSSEAAYQAQKTLDENTRIKFTKMTASASKRRGRLINIRNDWEQIKFNIMADIVYNKFKQNLGLYDRLLNTGDIYLIEGNTHGDRVWGQVNGIGENLLGIALMQVRDRLRQEKNN